VKKIYAIFEYEIIRGSMENNTNIRLDNTGPMDISDDDIIEAMKAISGYLDITPGDFKEVYIAAYKHAVERLTRSTTAKDVMSVNVIFVKADSPLTEVAATMSHHKVSGVPVVNDKGAVVGVISEKDFLIQMGAEASGSFMGVVAICLKGPNCVAMPIRKQYAENIMSSPAITISENATVSEIAEMLTDKKINRIPVVDQNRRLVGIVTRTNLVQSFCSIP
jgi:CBS domain-containing protein